MSVQDKFAEVIFMKKKFLVLSILSALLLLSACSPAKEAAVEKKHVVIGFSQCGTESAWRKQHTRSIIDELKGDNYQVLYRNGYMNQERQIQDIRTFIAYKVDIIVFVPLQEKGWEPVLEEAKEARIPVIVADRNINVSDQSLYISHIGPSFKAEGNRAGLYVTNHFAKSDKQSINILELSGLSDTSPTIFRKTGFMEAIRRDPRMRITDTLNGDYIRLKGKSEMETYIASHDIADVDVLFSYNDEMTLGALEALKETNIAPGSDLIIVSIDGQENMIEQLQEGNVNCVVECNPNAGWYVANAIQRYFKGHKIAQEIYVPETVFSDQGDLDHIPPRNY